MHWSRGVGQQRSLMDLKLEMAVNEFFPIPAARMHMILVFLLLEGMGHLMIKIELYLMGEG